MSTTNATLVAIESIQRLSGLDLSQLEVAIRPDNGADYFTARGASGVLHITANNAGTAVRAYAMFARTAGFAHVGRYGTRPFDASIPDTAELSQTARVPHRVAYNICVAGYTTPFFTWSDWEAELDLLAASGITAAHVTLGQEQIWLETFTRFGYTEEEVLRWIVAPSHQPWMWLNNIHSYGHGTSRSLIERRAALARQVIARMLELDITPILPAFSGTVPQGFDERNPDADIVPQGKWFMDVAGPVRPDWLPSSTASYSLVAAEFYRQQERLFGATTLYAADLLHEGGKAGDYDITDAAAGVQRALLAAHPDATWVIQAWAGNPRQRILDGIDTTRALILDLTGDGIGQVGGYQGAAWAAGILPNYGGRTVLYGDLEAVADLPVTAFNRADGYPDPTGFTNMAEGVGNNPVLWDLFSDIAWTDTAVDLQAWLSEWVTSRYGADSADAIAAWKTLLTGPYASWITTSRGDTPTESTLTGQGQDVDAASPLPLIPGAAFDMTDDAELADFQFYASTDSVIAAVPSLNANQASSVGPRVLAYDPNITATALEQLVAVSGAALTPGHAHDLVDVARQAAEDHARTLLEDVRIAASQRDLSEYDRATEQFLALIDSLDAVLATHQDFLLGTWTAAAAAWGSDTAESTYLAEEATRLLTVWGDKDAMFLTEYANRGWAGLVGDYYRSRWNTWFEQVRNTLTTEATTSLNWYTFGESWLRNTTRTETAPVGDVVTEATHLLHRLQAPA